jgi:hypothetical protein
MTATPRALPIFSGVLGRKFCGSTIRFASPQWRIAMTEQAKGPYAETYCPYCGAEEPHWNGPRSDPEWHDLLNKQDAEITRLRAERDQLLAAMKEMIDWYGDDKGKWPCVDRALAAVAAVEEKPCRG